jgi:hypothetical protein
MYRVFGRGREGTRVDLGDRLRLPGDSDLPGDKVD